ncbi:hypothetical protein H2204_006305 [Knufia peltigerae]|uniref:Xylanolytic transcriptional activator regulatory domain-containing protein n=1 Tax=Knufia peltigerae TaxID=1002370 RepID=A0AA38Y5A0_9EURO|nr:hypothetical protein H2204_006305 [Knufia peltigerae]
MRQNVGNADTDEDSDHDDHTNDDDDNDRDNLYPHEIVRKAVVRGAWAQMSQGINRSLFGFGSSNVDLAPFHPQQVQIFRLWQIYLENVNPLLAVTHTPTLQPRMIDAAGNLSNIPPPLEALMFGIYCVSVLSLGKEDCQSLFGIPRDDLLKSYQFGCEQALLKCDVLRTEDLDCLVALYLYLVSFRPGTDPRSVSSMLGIAMRIAQRLGIHYESINTKCGGLLEAEMRRRLWWSLVIFDHRICELSDYKTTMLSPTWDCKTPLNINDSDIRAEMTTTPIPHDRPSETLFAVVRSEMSDFVRHTSFHLDFTNPALKGLATTNHNHINHNVDSSGHGDELSTLENLMESKHLRFCNPENPLHFMTVWVTRGHLARNRLLDHHSRHSSLMSSNTTTTTSTNHSNSNTNPSPNSHSNPNTPHSSHHLESSAQQHDSAMTYAMRMLECDTRLMTSPLTKGYAWYMHNYFPFPAYIHIVRSLEKRPTQKHADQAWSVMSDNYDARFSEVADDDNPLFKVFSGAILQAWDARVAATSNSDTGENQRGEENQPPRIIVKIKLKLSEIHTSTATTTITTTTTTTTTNTQPGVTSAQDTTTTAAPGTILPTMSIDNNNMGGTTTFGYGGNNAMTGPEFPDSWDVSSSSPNTNSTYNPTTMPGRGMGWFDYGPLDWSSMGWNPMFSRGW